MANINAIREAMQAVVGAIAPTEPKHAKVTRKVTMQPKGIYECPKCNNKVQVHLPVFAVECIRHNDGPITMSRRSK
jgi:hypothetical protein